MVSELLVVVAKGVQVARAGGIVYLHGSAKNKVKTVENKFSTEDVTARLKFEEESVLKYLIPNAKVLFQKTQLRNVTRCTPN